MYVPEPLALDPQLDVAVRRGDLRAGRDLRTVPLRVATHSYCEKVPLEM